jgi:SAM-dependent methyltransferase
MRCAPPQHIQGVKCFAPELAHAEKDYPAEAFARLVQLEANNFWFRSRNRIIVRMFRKYLRTPQPARVLEIGCGTGFVLSALREEKCFELVGAEQHLRGLLFAKQRLPDVEFVQLNARALPYCGEYQAIGAFDVLEHIEQDEEVMASVHSALAPGGLFFITVPQHAWLWSTTDDHACHKRRYSRTELLGKLRRNGFRIRRCTSFVFGLLPLMYLSRLCQRGKKTEAAVADAVYDELALPRFIDLGMETVMRIDELLIAANLSLPVGGSLLVVAERAASELAAARGVHTSQGSPRQAR